MDNPNYTAPMLVPNPTNPNELCVNYRQPEGRQLGVFASSGRTCQRQPSDGYLR